MVARFVRLRMKRGIAYFGVRNPEWVRIDMQRIRTAGYTHVLHTWAEEDLHYYPETMSRIIDISREEGLEVYVNPWGVGRVFGGEAYSELTGRNPSMAQIGSDGSHRVAACPNHPDFRSYMFQWIDTVCQTAVETIFWDEPHFDFLKGDKSLWSCRCQTCQKLYLDQQGHPMPQNITETVKIFRENCLVDFLKVMTERVHGYGKRNSVCMLPPWFPAGLDDWDQIAALPSVDEIGSDPYWEKDSTLESIPKNYTEVSERIARLAAQYGKEGQMWVKNYHIVDGTEHLVKEATEASYKAGIRNIFAWSYLGSSYLSWLKSDRPELVWQIQCEALQNCQSSRR